MTYPAMHTQDIICYELRSFFHDSPSLLNCPICGCVLEVKRPLRQRQKNSASAPLFRWLKPVCTPAGYAVGTARTVV
jgi:hypothetical protein